MQLLFCEVFAYRICLKSLEAFLCSFHLAFSQYVLPVMLVYSPNINNNAQKKEQIKYTLVPVTSKQLPKFAALCIP